MGNKKLSEMESLAIINQMISNAKNEITDSGNTWLVWGWLIFIASLSTFIFIELNFENIFLGWNIFGIAVILFLIYDIMKPKKDKKVKTYVSEILHYFGIGFTVCLVVIIVSINISGDPNIGFGYFLMVYAFLMLMQGGVLKFKPLIIGAVVNWVGAVAIFLNPVFKYDMLITAIAVFIGYIIPGYILRRQYRKKMEALKELI
jgi:hypothetical protein